MIIDEIMLGLKFRERENNKDRAEMILKGMSNNNLTLFIIKKILEKNIDVISNRKENGCSNARPQKTNTFIYSYSVNLAKIPRYWREKRKHDYYYYYN